MKAAIAVLWAAGASAAFGAQPDPTPAQRMAASVIHQWPAGVVSTAAAPGTWGEEEGVLLDGIAAEWHQTADGPDYDYIKAAVDRYIDKDGNIAGFKDRNLDDIEMGRAVLLVYRVTLEPRYYKAAKFLHDRLAVQPRTPSGGYGHTQADPNQIGLDEAYMVEPFRAEYAATFQSPEDFDDIAKQFLLMDAHMRDPATGLLVHGWDESKTMPGGRALGWYSMGLVDALDFFPADHPQRPALIAALNRAAATALKFQDPASGLWSQVLDPPQCAGTVPEASVSSMLVYALARGVRLGYLPQSNEAAALKGWGGIQKRFIASAPGGRPILSGSVKSGSFGGTCGVDNDLKGGTDNDPKGIGAYLLAGSEIEQAPTEAIGQGKTVLMDAWFNSQTRANPSGHTALFHYKWDDDFDTGFSFVGFAFQRFGAKLAELPTAPTLAGLSKAQIYMIVSPDIPIKNPNPHYMDKSSADAIEAWVKQGGVLILMMNDVNNTDFTHMNTLSERFGIHFNPVDRNLVTGTQWEMGMLHIPVTDGIFPTPLTIYMKEICTIAASGPAKPIYTDKGDTLMAVAKVGKGTVYATVDPWLYNEYTDGRKLPPLYQQFQAAKDLTAWAIRTAR
jgi:unsaturated rhamnogalacturonyl hydrolase